MDKIKIVISEKDLKPFTPTKEVVTPPLSSTTGATYTNTITYTTIGVTTTIISDNNYVMGYDPYRPTDDNEASRVYWEEAGVFPDISENERVNQLASQSGVTSEDLAVVRDIAYHARRGRESGMIDVEIEAEFQRAQRDVDIARQISTLDSIIESPQAELMRLQRELGEQTEIDSQRQSHIGINNPAALSP